MPFYLKDRDITSDVAGLQSVLIVPCRFCPAANLALRENKPYLAPFWNLMRTPAYESYVQRLKADLEGKGKLARVFDSRLPNQFIVCMWTKKRRKQLETSAAGYDAAIVLGCDAAVATVQDSVKSTDCRVVSGMETQGIMSVVPSLRSPFEIWLNLSSVSTLEQDAAVPPEIVQDEIA